MATRSLIVVGLVSFASCSAATALANPRPLPFTYQHEQLAEGATEIEQFVDLTPVRTLDAGGALRWYGLTEYQTEFEHGLTDRLELGLYVTIVPGVAPGFSTNGIVPRPMEGSGVKQRLRYQLAPTGEWPIDVGVYGEVSENEREVELEAKVILQRRFGIARIIANLTGEQEFYYNADEEFVLTPSAGVTFEATPSVQPGVEWWMLAEYSEKSSSGPNPPAHHYVGPALLAQFGNLWWSTGLYYQMNNPGHTLLEGEAFGHFWVRTVVGIGL